MSQQFFDHQKVDPIFALVGVGFTLNYKMRKLNVLIKYAKVFAFKM
jgi:hypothetical protein